MILFILSLKKKQKIFYPIIVIKNDGWGAQQLLYSIDKRSGVYSWIVARCFSTGLLPEPRAFEMLRDLLRVHAAKGTAG